MIESMSKTFPFLAKLFALIIGGIISLVLSGDINLDSNNQAQLNINLKVVLKLLCSIGMGLYLGEFTIDYWDFEHLNYYAQSAVLMAFSIFGMLAFGVLYRSVQLTFTDKELSEIITEVKKTIKALF